uniref:Uncharacterized protein n=1 Tax=Arundo donax TaxID=35708 RepID=A0A0A9BZ96_ARUDO
MNSTGFTGKHKYRRGPVKPKIAENW